MQVMARRDDVDRFIAARTATIPDFPDLVAVELEVNRVVLGRSAERDRCSGGWRRSNAGQFWSSAL